MGRRINSRQISDEIVSGYIESGVIHLVKDNGEEIIVTGVIQGADGATIDLSSLSQDIIPSEANTINLGSAEKPFKEIFVSSNTIYIGSVPLSVKDDSLNIGNSRILSVSPDTEVLSAVISVTEHLKAEAEYTLPSRFSGNELTNAQMTVLSIEHEISMGLSLVESGNRNAEDFMGTAMQNMAGVAYDLELNSLIPSAMSLNERIYDYGINASMGITLPEVASLDSRVSITEYTVVETDNKVDVYTASLDARVSINEHTITSSVNSVGVVNSISSASLDTRISAEESIRNLNILSLSSKIDSEALSGTSGIKGQKGDTGSVGPSGPAGVKGQSGLKGPKGNDGVNGNIGPKGPAGIKGNIGPRGYQGATGPKGQSGLKGPKGDDGVNGNVGPKGPKGPIGDVNGSTPKFNSLDSRLSTEEYYRVINVSSLESRLSYQEMVHESSMNSLSQQSSNDLSIYMSAIASLESRISTIE